MDLARARLLTDPGLRAALRRLSEEHGLEPADEVRLQRTLRKEFGPERGAALAEQLVLRDRARARLGSRFADWLWSEDLLQMASHPAVASRRARRFAEVALPVVDGTTGAGVDLWALRDAGVAAWGIERDAVAVLLAAENVGSVIRGDVRAAPVAPERVALFLDPARRREGSRVVRGDAYEPPITAVLALLEGAAFGAAKLAPGFDWRDLAEAFEIEVVQLGRSLRELVLWSGIAASRGLRRAVLVDCGCELTSNDPSAVMSPRPIGQVLYDPQPAVTRAGLVSQLAALLGAGPIEAGGAYLTSDELVPTPFARAFAVLDVFPFSVARLRGRLRRAGWRLGEVLRRHFPLTPEELRRLVGKLEGEPVALLCTRIEGRPVAIVAQPVSANGER